MDPEWVTIIATYAAFVALLTFVVENRFRRWSRLKVALVCSAPLPLLMIAVGGLQFVYLTLFPWKDKGTDHYAMAFLGPVILIGLSFLALLAGYLVAWPTVSVLRRKAQRRPDDR